MKILITIPCLMRGGTEMQTLSLAASLITLGHTVIVLCYFEYDEAVVEELEAAGASVLNTKLTRSCGLLRLISALRKEFIEINPDIIHVQYMSPGAIPIIAAKLSGIKNIFALVHQPWTESHGIRAKSLLRAASLLTTRFMAVSLSAEKSWFGSSSLFDEKKTFEEWGSHFTIYNSVNTARIKEICGGADPKGLKERISIQEGSIVIGTVSRLRHEKGIDVLVDSFIALKEEGFNIHLLIVGGGPDKSMLERRVADSGYSGSVTFYGVAEWSIAIKLISVIDIFVVPSRFEGFGLAAAEAMAAGKPVIASDAFGLMEVVEHDVTGLIFKAGDSDALAEAIRKLVKSSLLRKEFACKGIAKVKACFEQVDMINKVRVLYNPK